ncbi:MAG TPA: uracil-DNA glycosylase, partial [Candidatus Woesebacteria bacterium]|nr:uracil-DNA glycosylase [Candidatus Woesebacteria bacterium]
NDMDKENQLKKLTKKIERDPIYKHNFMGKMVFGEGNVNANIMFVGEAPGKQEAETGRPFIGRSGQLLRSLIRDIGLKEEDVYITSPVKYLPKHGTPTKKEIAHARVDFMKQVQIINPKILVLLGKTAIFAVLNEDIPLLKKHGEIRTIDNKTYLLTLHPAAVLRFPQYAPLIKSDFTKVKQYIST